jgi:hypothetical protein
VRAVLLYQADGGHLLELSNAQHEHSHPPECGGDEVRKLKEELKQKARESTNRLKDVFSEVCSG